MYKQMLLLYICILNGYKNLSLTRIGSQQTNAALQYCRQHLMNKIIRLSVAVTNPKNLGLH